MRERGYNQSELLAKELMRKFLTFRMQNLLKSIRKIKLNIRIKGKERESNVQGVYRVIDSQAVADKNILIIDDIITTGNTLGECCKVLKKAGCKNICCAALCAAIV